VFLSTVSLQQKTAGETIITAKTFNGKTAVLRCIVANENEPATTIPATSPAIIKTPQQTAGTSTDTPSVSNTPISFFGTYTGRKHIDSCNY